MNKTKALVKRGKPPKIQMALVKKKVSLPTKAAEGVRAITAVDPQALLAQAIDKNLPIESMERLLAMRDKMKAEWAKDQFFIALSGFQSECPIIEKTHQVRDKDKQTKADKGLRYAYAAIEDLVEPVRPLLMKWGLSWTSKPSQTREDVTANIYVHHRDGHEEVTSFTVPIDPDAYMSDPQKAAAALTFATRYAFKSAFGIQTKGEDNDAQPDDEPRRGYGRREPIQPPREKDAPVPVKHEEVKALSDYDKILRYLKATEMDPKTKTVVGLFSENEQLDYAHEAKEAQGKPEELTRILADIIETGKKRRAAVKGE
jgi:hypothetical protein